MLPILFSSGKDFQPDKSVVIIVISIDYDKNLIPERI